MTSADHKKKRTADSPQKCPHVGAKGAVLFISALPSHERQTTKEQNFQMALQARTAPNTPCSLKLGEVWAVKNRIQGGPLLCHRSACMAGLLETVPLRFRRVSFSLSKTNWGLGRDGSVNKVPAKKALGPESGSLDPM